MEEWAERTGEGAGRRVRSRGVRVRKEIKKMVSMSRRTKTVVA